MSTSTLSATENPTAATAARRRPVVSGDKRTGLDFSGSDKNAAVSPALDRNFTGAEMVNNPLSPNSTTRRKKPKKPRWQTVLSVLTKNLILLLIILLLAQMIRWLALGKPAIYPSEFEQRVDELEALVKTTTKMMQVQVEVVDRKIDKGIIDLRSELSERMDDKGSEIRAQLRDFDERIESVKGSLNGEWLRKDEFEKFLKEFKGKGKGFNGDMKLDAIRAFAKGIIEEEMEKHAADGIGRVDYAVATGGAMVVKHSKHFDHWDHSWFKQDGVHSNAVKILQPSFGEPGQCFPLKGNSGFVQIRLRKAIIPEAITLEHVAKSVAFDRSTAPKECKVLGWLHSHGENMLLLTEFTYDLQKSHVQTFNVLEGLEPLGSVDTIRLDFTSNHGNPNFTCIYRLRVHGHEPM